jgi:hypothetical protein
MTIFPALLIASILLPGTPASTPTAPLTAGTAMPQLKGEFLTSREAVLPDAASGRVALVTMGFTYNSRFQVEAWIGRFRKDYGANPGVTFFEVPMIGGMARLGKWFIDSGMRSGTAKADQENVITVYGGTDTWKARVGLKNADDACLLLLDGKGIIRWTHNGPFDEAAYKELTAQLTTLLAASSQNK